MCDKIKKSYRLFIYSTNNYRLIAIAHICLIFDNKEDYKKFEKIYNDQNASDEDWNFFQIIISNESNNYPIESEAGEQLTYIYPRAFKHGLHNNNVIFIYNKDTHDWKCVRYEEIIQEIKAFHDDLEKKDCLSEKDYEEFLKIFQDSYDTIKSFNRAKLGFFPSIKQKNIVLHSLQGLQSKYKNKTTAISILYYNNKPKDNVSIEDNDYLFLIKDIINIKDDCSFISATYPLSKDASVPNEIFHYFEAFKDKCKKLKNKNFPLILYGKPLILNQPIHYNICDEVAILYNKVFLRYLSDKYKGIQHINDLIVNWLLYQEIEDIPENTKLFKVIYTIKDIISNLVFLIDKIILNKYEGINSMGQFLKHWKEKTLKIKSSLNNNFETFANSYDDEGKPWEKIKEELENKYKLTENDFFLLDYLNRINNAFKHKEFVTSNMNNFYYKNNRLHLDLNNEKDKIKYCYIFSMFLVIAECSSIINKLSSDFEN